MFFAVERMRFFFPNTENLGTKLAALVICSGIGALIYVGAHLTLWWLSGKPEGPEIHLLTVAKLFMKKLNIRKLRFIKSQG